MSLGKVRRPQRLRWACLIILGAGCGGKQDVSGDTGGYEVPVPGEYPQCDIDCEQGLDAFQLNAVVLTGDTDAPTLAGADLPLCAHDDVEWPCNLWADLNNDLRAAHASDEDSARPLVCEDTADLFSCIRFDPYLSYVFYSDIDTGFSDECQRLLELADGAGYDTSDTAYGLGADVYYPLLRRTAAACEDRSVVVPYSDHINVFLWDNHHGNTSFQSPAGDNEVCHSYVFADKGRLPNVGQGSDFDDGMTEHEVGHSFGLGHVCSTPFEAAGGSTNFMTSGIDADCCVECNESASDTSSPWFAESVDCLVPDTAMPFDTAGECRGPAIGLDQGDRAGGADDSLVDTRDGKYQTDQMLDRARDHCVCACIDHYTLESRVGVVGELDCFAGSGDFALVMTGRVDSDDDGEAWAQLRPVLISGNHLGRLSWLTSAEVIDWGDYTHLFVGTTGRALAFDAQDPDALDEQYLHRFDSTTLARTWGAGTVATATRWTSDEVDASLDEVEWPVVRLAWTCSSDYSAPDAYTVVRPPNAYRLPVKHLDSGITWKQELLLRPDFEDAELVIEVRGAPGLATTVALDQVGTTDRWSWSMDIGGFDASGWLEEAGTPVGQKLRVHIDDGTFETKTWSDDTLPDLLKMP